MPREQVTESVVNASDVVAELADALAQWRGDAHSDGDDYAEAAYLLVRVPSRWCPLDPEVWIHAHRVDLKSMQDEKARILRALDFRPEELPQPNGPVARKWWRLGWLSAQAVAKDVLGDKSDERIR